MRELPLSCNMLVLFLIASYFKVELGLLVYPISLVLVKCWSFLSDKFNVNHNGWFVKTTAFKYISKDIFSLLASDILKWTMPI